MSPFWSRIRALVLPLLLGNAVILTSEFFGGRLYPLPPDVDARDHAAMETFTKGLPTSAHLLVLAGWGLGTLAAGWLAAHLAPAAPRRQALLIGGLLLVAGVLNMLSLPHPTWFRVSGVLLFLPCALLGARLGTRLSIADTGGAAR